MQMIELGEAENFVERWRGGERCSAPRCEMRVGWPIGRSAFPGAGDGTHTEVYATWWWAINLAKLTGHEAPKLHRARSRDG